MAEFKLGRIRFVWKDAWSTGTTYYRDDVVSFGGKVYICVIGHTSQADFFSDLDITPSKWNLVADGLSWKGEWQPQTRYVYNDIVKYGARLYIATEVHESAEDSATGLEADQSKWDIFGEGLDWKGDWSPSFDYKVNDLVKYGGSTYVCNTPHISAATASLGLEDDQNKWTAFNNGLDYKGQWTSSVRYKYNDVVQFGSSIYICLTHHTSSADFATDVARWTQLVEGLQFEGDWSPFRQYQQGDIIRWGGNQYVATVVNTAENPTDNTDTWKLFTQNFRFMGEWGSDSSAQTYRVGEVVKYGGYTYICTADHDDQEPPNASYWAVLNTGLEWRGVWLDDQEYKLGDVVRFGSNTYVCILGHISEGDDGSTIGADPQGGGNANSRPDQDTNGTYWNILSIGTETSVLTTEGDLVYYGGAGPTRLPIGEEGQVLRVSQDALPEWAYIGVADDVYFVGIGGQDLPAPAWGRSIDKPWASIRYATEQVENGVKNPKARRLLELNRQFIQREIVEWTDWQIANAAVGSIWESFTYSESFCERDMGYLVDALVWDITHGGNVRTREAALRYFTEAGLNYVAGQEAQTVASINYGLTVMGHVLAQTDPAVNYQSTNGDNSSAIVDQWKDATLIAETGVLAELTSLTAIVTDAITAGETTNIPAKVIRNTLIKVATGQYKEVLPIIVPAECCILGDELRSTNVQPKKTNLIPRTDVGFSYQALVRLEEIIGDVVTGTAVTPTTGNTTSQEIVWPLAETNERNVTEQLARVIRRHVDFSIGDKIEKSLTKTYAMSDVNFGYFRDLILNNKEFLKAEIVGFISDTYPNIKYSKTSCKKDVGYIVDAIAYDLTYGGNWQSITAGLAYFNGNNGVLQIDGTEKTATLAAYTYLKSMIQNVGRNILVTPGYQDAVAQIRGTAGSNTASTTAGTLIENIRTIINLGPNSAPATVYPDVSGASGTVQAAASTLLANSTAIGTDTIDFISKNFGSFKYDSAKCRRDLRLIMTDIAYGAVFGSNFNAVQNGISYTRANANVVTGDQLTETVGALLYAKGLVNTSVTSDGSSATGSSTFGTRTNAAFNEIIDILENGTSAADALTFPDHTGVVANRKNAKDRLQANRQYLIDNLIGWINNEIADGAGSSGAAIWDGFTYDQDKCARDTGYIIDALSYDIMYTGTLATTRVAQSYFVDGLSQIAGQEANSVAAFTYLATAIESVVQNIAVSPDYTVTTQDTSGSAASATEASELTAKVTIINNAITAGNLDSLPAIVFPNISAESAELQAALSSLNSDIEEIIPLVIQYINETYNDFNYNQAKCARDVRLIIEAAAYDAQLGTNFAGIVAAYSYLRRPSSKVIGEQKTASIAAFEYAKTQAAALVTGITAVENSVNDTFNFVNDMIFVSNPEANNRATDKPNLYAATRLLELNKDFIVAEVHAYINDYYSGTVNSIASNVMTVDSTAWMKQNLPIEFVSPQDSTNTVEDTNLVEGQVYYVKDILSATTITISETPGGTAVAMSDHEAGKTFTIKFGYDYSVAACTRDVIAYIDAMKWDLTYPQQYVRNYTDSISFNLPGLYKSRLAARYYVNAVLGSQEEDMYYLRNGTGLRLQTLDGLQGDLSPANEYGTSRPTAGAYASLDPGWGPDDERVWIIARSPYVQNLTTFGYAAVGQKIDGSLHNGGNDSIVSNDFTQVISDGIGAWITNNGRAELVSVFTYYAHIGYLAEAGGRIRATNGNNSYGDFGSVAEGVDPEETPVTAIVDNRLQYRATISDVSVDGDQVIAVEYNHAGNDYTRATISVFGSGNNAAVDANEFRDDAVNRVRLLEFDDSSNQLGGEGYLEAENTAQTGSTSSITLAATDGQPSNAYPGMRVLITGGAGVGQHGLIETYNSGSKVAPVLRETSTVVQAGNFVIGQKYRIDTVGSTDFTGISTLTVNESGLIFTATGAGAGTGTATLLESGWDHLNPGSAIEAVNSSSTYRIEPAVAFTAPPFSSEADTIASAATNTDIKYVESVAAYTGVASTTESVFGSGATFDVTRNGSKYFVTVNNGGTRFQRLETVTISGADLGGVTPTNDIEIIITNVNENGTIVTFDFEGFGRAGHYMLTANASQAFQYSADGATWTASTTTGGSAPSGAVKVESGLIDDGSSLNLVSSVVVVGQSTTSDQVWISDSAIGTWTNVDLGTAYNSEPHIAFGDNKYVVIFEGSRNVLQSSNGGLTWITEVDALPSTGFTGLAFGAGVFVAVKAGTTDSVYAPSNNLTTWTTTTLPGTSAWADIAFGNNRFITISSDDNKAAYSLDRGTTWIDSDMPDNDGSSVNAYTKIEYGQGLFMAVAYNSGVADLEAYNNVYISENGLDWLSKGVAPSAGTDNGYSVVGFGNPQKTGQWIAKAGGNSTHIAKISAGARARGRVGIANERVFEVRLLEPGSGYANGAPSMSITDPNNIYPGAFEVRLGKGSLGNPTFVNRGTAYQSASAELTGDLNDGFADFYQTGRFIAVRRLSERPVAGSNIVFDSLPDQVFKLVNTVSFLGDVDGSYTAFLNISPAMTVPDAPEDGDGVTMRIRYSQVRLTGHDFLDIGTGNFVKTNYPGAPAVDPDQTKETNDADGGRVFFTATDQDGNFRVGDLFSIEQATGVATLNAEAFNIAGLQELSLGEVTLGGNSASITEFSTDPFFTANSDTIVPTQRAIKAYIEAQIGGGGASLNVNSVTAGDIFVGTNTITTVSSSVINIKAKVNFQGGVTGLPVAYNYMLR